MTTTDPTLVPSAGVVPASYVCSHCGVAGCKLWRRSVSSFVGLACINCLRLHTDDPDRMASLDDAGFHRTRLLPGSDEFRLSDLYEGYVPAVPTHLKYEMDGQVFEDDTYWGYTSVPAPGVYWWRWLPNLMQP